MEMLHGKQESLPELHGGGFQLKSCPAGQGPHLCLHISGSVFSSLPLGSPSPDSI